MTAWTALPCAVHGADYLNQGCGCTEIQKALDMVVKLVESEGAEMALDFELGSSVYCKAKVADVTSVSLWLGAGVMVEYPLAEAQVRASEGKKNRYS